MGQEEYYSEQYSHGQGSSEPINQQYYPDGNSAPHLGNLFAHAVEPQEASGT